jgi:hypothetical protein
MKPQPGYYRRLLSNPNIRIAFTHTPIIGCTKIDCTPVIEELKLSSDGAAKYYIDGLENGEMVTIIENTYRDDFKHYKPGELYFKT